MESSKYQEDSPPLLLLEKFVKLYQQNIIRYADFFCWLGDTQIWTGEKGFAVPRLTARPCRQNGTKKYMKIFHFFSGGGVFVFVLVSGILFYLIIPFPKKNKYLPFSLDWIYIFDCLYSILKQTQYWKKPPPPFYWKTNCVFSVTKQKFRTNWNH